jgi:signal transduction histidine kinase
LAASERAARASVSAQRRGYEESLGRLLANASNKEESGTSLTALAIHDANTAFAIIMGSSQLLQMQLPGDIAKEEDLKRIDSTVRLGKYLLQNLFILGASETEWPRQPAFLHGLIEEGLEECRGELRSKRIVVRTRSAERKDNGPGFEMDIDDGGGPLGEEAKSQFFDPRGGTFGRGKGVGLGLYLAREILRRHGGEASVSSAEGGGNRLVVRLPAATGPNAAPVRIKGLTA